MSEPVKRNYVAVRRAATARQTRRAVVDAAAALYLRDGFGRTTMDAVAHAAGVSRKTVFRAVGGKVELLTLAIDWAAAGDDRDVPLAERDAIADLAAQVSTDAIMARWAVLTAAIGSRMAGLSLVLAEAAGADPAARDLRGRAQMQRHLGATAFAEFLAGRGLLRSDVSVNRAADLVWLHSDPSMYRLLVVERNWSNDEFVAWLTRTVGTQLFTPARKQRRRSQPPINGAPDRR